MSLLKETLPVNSYTHTSNFCTKQSGHSSSWGINHVVSESHLSICGINLVVSESHHSSWTSNHVVRENRPLRSSINHIMSESHLSSGSIITWGERESPLKLRHQSCGEGESPLMYKGLTHSSRTHYRNHIPRLEQRSSFWNKPIAK